MAEGVFRLSVGRIGLGNCYQRNYLFFDCIAQKGKGHCMLFVRELGFIREIRDSIVFSFSDRSNLQKQNFGSMGQK